MTDVFGAYTLDAQYQLGSHSNVHSTGAVAVASLDDSTFLAAYVDQTTENIQVVHLDGALTVLGTASITGGSSPTANAYRALHFIHTGGTDALLINQDWDNNLSQAWPVDGSAGTPTVGSVANHTGTYPWRDSYYGPLSFYLKDSGRALYTYEWQNPDTSNREIWLMVLNSTTGAVVGRVFVYDWDESDYIGMGSLTQSPTDVNVFTVTDNTGKPWSVEIDPVAGTGSRVASPTTTLDVGDVTGGGLLQIGGNPYIAGTVVVDRLVSGSYPTTSIYELHSIRYPDGAAGPVQDLGHNWVAVQYTGSQYADQAIGVGFHMRADFLTGYHANDAINFIALDQTAEDPTFVSITLPFDYTPATGIDSGNAAWATHGNPITGKVVVGATFQDRSTNTIRPHIWALTGPIFAEPEEEILPPEVDEVGFYTDAGARHILNMFIGEEVAYQYLWVALCRTAPNRYMTSEDLDEVDTVGYERIMLNVGEDWVSFQGNLFNEIDVTWTVIGDVRGWAVLDSPESGQVLYGGDWNTYWYAPGTYTAARAEMTVALAQTDWAMEGEDA